MSILLALVLCFVGLMIAASGALIGIGFAAFFDLSIDICALTGAAIALAGAIAGDWRGSRTRIE